MATNMGFTSLTIREFGPDPKTKRMRYILTEPLEFTMYASSGKAMFFVPTGFVTDFASVPRIFWPIFPPNGIWQRAAVLHDFLYSRKDTCSRFLADAIFREAMAVLKTPWWIRVLMYYAVRLFGWLAWNKTVVTDRLPQNFLEESSSSDD